MQIIILSNIPRFISNIVMVQDIKDSRLLQSVTKDKKFISEGTTLHKKYLLNFKKVKGYSQELLTSL